MAAAQGRISISQLQPQPIMTLSLQSVPLHHQIQTQARIAPDSPAPAQTPPLHTLPDISHSPLPHHPMGRAPPDFLNVTTDMNTEVDALDPSIMDFALQGIGEGSWGSGGQNLYDCVVAEYISKGFSRTHWDGINWDEILRWVLACAAWLPQPSSLHFYPVLVRKANYPHGSSSGTALDINRHGPLKIWDITPLHPSETIALLVPWFLSFVNLWLMEILSVVLGFLSGQHMVDSCCPGRTGLLEPRGLWGNRRSLPLHSRAANCAVSEQHVKPFS